MTESRSWELSAVPSLSVVVATRDRPEMLSRALCSIIGQEYAGPIDVHVVFDQSEPHPIAEDWKAYVRDGSRREVHVLANTRTPGLPGARNSGVDAATGELIAFCDDDDEWLQGKADAQVAALKANPGRCFVAGGVEVAYADRVRPRIAPDGDVTFDHVRRERVMELHPSTFLMHARALREEIGPVDEDIPGGYGEDYDLMLRAARVAPLLSLPGPLARVYWHTSSFFSDRWRMIADANEYLKAKHPEFAADPHSMAWLDGKTAFALAAIGQRAEARRLAVSTLRRRPSQRQALAALLVSTGAVRASWVQRAAQTLGRGI